QAHAGGGRPAADALRPGRRQLRLVGRPPSRLRSGNGEGRRPADGDLALGQDAALGWPGDRPLLAARPRAGPPPRPPPAPLPTPRAGRPGLSAVAIAAVAALAVGAYVLFGDRDVESPGNTPAPVEEASAQQVHQFCGACHAYPPPDSFPRFAWRKEVEQGYKF